MADRALIIVSSGEEAREKAMTGIMYAVNAKKNNWLEDVKLMFFGPSEKLILSDDDEIKNSMETIRKVGLVPTACKAIARNENIEPRLINMGVNVEFVGTIVSNLIKEGYSVLTF